MGCGSFIGLIILGLLGFCRGQSDSLASRHHYDCGEYGMQLLVFPSQGQNIHFKVVDEFRTAFEVSNCSSCLHWITSNADGAAIFSAGYNGCHVLKKDGRNHLKVRVEELTRNGAVAATQDIILICPKQEHIPTLDGNMHPMPLEPGLVPHQPLPPQPGLVPHQPLPPQPGLVPHQPLPPQPGLVPHQPLPPQPGLVPHQPLPPQPGLVPHQPLPPQPGLVPHQLLPPQPGLVPHQPPQPGLVPHQPPQPGLVPHQPPPPQPGLVPHQPPPPQPGLVPHQPPPGLVPHQPPEPGLVPHQPPQPGLVPHQPPQPGLVPHQPVAPQPGLVPHQPVAPQPGLVPHQPVAPQPGLVPHQPVAPQPGLVPHQPPQPGLVPHQPPQPGLVPHQPPQPGLVPHQPPQPGLVPHQPPQPGLVPHQPPQPGLVPHQPPQPGLVPHQPPQPGLVPHQPPQPGLVPHQPVPPQPGLVPHQPMPHQPVLPQPGLVPPQPLPPQPGLVPHQPPQPGLVPHQPPQPGLVPHQPVPHQPGHVPHQPGHVPHQPLPHQPGHVPHQPGHVPHQPLPHQPGHVPHQPLPPQPGHVPHQPLPPQPGHVPPQPVPPQPGHVPPQPVPPQPGHVPPQPVLPQPGHVPPQPVPPQPGPVPPQPVPPQPVLIRPMPHQPMPQPGLRRPVPPQPVPPQPGLGRPMPPQPVPPQPDLGRPVPPQPMQPQPGPGHPVPHLYSPVSNIGSPLTLAQCQVPSGKIPCVGAQGPAACYQAGCCYNEGDHIVPCYYGNTVTVQCLQDGHFILVVSRHILDYPVILDTVKLSHARAGCDPTRKTEDFLVFRFPLTQCGTTIQMTGGRLIYENQLVSGIAILNGPDGSITRDSTFILHTRCIYNATDFLPVQAEIILPSTPAPVSQMGPLRLELRIATDASYRSYYSDGDYPVVKVLGDPVHVEVRLLQRMDPTLVLILHECWASPSANPLEQLQWPILVDGCPFKGDNYRTQLVPLGPASSEQPFPAHYQHFIISTFTFVDSGSQMVLDGLVYLFCSVSVCYPSQLELCRTQCRRPVASRSRRFLEISNGTESLDLISTYGAVIFQESNQYQDKQVKDMVSSMTVTLLVVVLLPLLGIISFVAILVLWKKSKMAKLSW